MGRELKRVSFDFQWPTTLRQEKYEFLPIDKNGDCIDPQLCDNEEGAREWIKNAIGGWDGECVAWVIERHISYYPAHTAPRGENPDNYTILEVGGNKNALCLGGWIDKNS